MAKYKRPCTLGDEVKKKSAKNYQVMNAVEHGYKKPSGLGEKTFVISMICYILEDILYNFSFGTKIGTFFCCCVNS